MLRGLVVCGVGLWTLGCMAGRPIRQTSVMKVRTQEALVMAPDAPTGFGRPAPQGHVNLGLGASLAGGGSASEGERLLPLSGTARAAVAPLRGFELVATASVASVDASAPPLVRPISGYDGLLGRGTVGVRGAVEVPAGSWWSWSLDLGVDSSHLSVTETTTTTVRSRAEPDADSAHTQRWDDVRLHPYARTATFVGVPVAGAASLIVGVQAQTTPRYWRRRTEAEICTSFRGGGVDCATEGDVHAPPSPLGAVVAPTLGVDVDLGTDTFGAVLYANAGAQQLSAVPVGAAVSLTHHF
ncbi:MAG: hypothetical protein R3F59_38675 [Myxococcota bacterium]